MNPVAKQHVENCINNFIEAGLAAELDYEDLRTAFSKDENKQDFETLALTVFAFSAAPLSIDSLDMVIECVARGSNLPVEAVSRLANCLLAAYALSDVINESERHLDNERQT